MRQSGIIAAGALYALENNIPQLEQDHLAASEIANRIRNSERLVLDPDVVDTNIVIFRVEPDGTPAPASSFCQRLKDLGVWMLPFSHEHVRAVTHRDVTVDQCREAGDIVCRLAGQS